MEIIISIKTVIEYWRKFEKQEEKRNEVNHVTYSVAE